MGCDITLFTEVKINGKWIDSDNYKKETDGYRRCEIYDGRDYTLFGMLADVRNRHENNVISDPKGLPHDAGDTCSKEFASGSFYFSVSYLNLSELKAFFARNKTVKNSGFVDAENALRLDSGMEPHSWCQGTNNKSYVYREWSVKNNGIECIINKLELIKDQYWKIDSDEDVRVVFGFDN